MLLLKFGNWVLLKYDLEAHRLLCSSAAPSCGGGGFSNKWGINFETILYVFKKETITMTSLGKCLLSTTPISSFVLQGGGIGKQSNLHEEEKSTFHSGCISVSTIVIDGPDIQQSMFCFVEESWVTVH